MSNTSLLQSFIVDLLQKGVDEMGLQTVDIVCDNATLPSESLLLRVLEVVETTPYQLSDSTTSFLTVPSQEGEDDDISDFCVESLEGDNNVTELDDDETSSSCSISTPLCSVPPPPPPKMTLKRRESPQFVAGFFAPCQSQKTTTRGRKGAAPFRRHGSETMLSPKSSRWSSRCAQQGLPLLRQASDSVLQCPQRATTTTNVSMSVLSFSPCSRII